MSINAAANSNGTIGITSNIAWSANSNQTWLTVSPTSGSNNGTLTLTANSANTATTARTATVTVSGTGVTSQTITVTQQGALPAINLSNNALSLNATSNSSGTISITSNIAWSASSSQTWLTVSPTSGSNNGTLTLTANSANTATTARTATVTVSGTGVTAQTISVVQLGVAQGSENDLRMHSPVLAKTFPSADLDNVLTIDQYSDISFSILNSQNSIINRAVKLFIIKDDNSFYDVIMDSVLIFNPKEIKYFDRKTTSKLGKTIKYPIGKYIFSVKSAVTEKIENITINSNYIIDQGWGYGGNNTTVEIKFGTAPAINLSSNALSLNATSNSSGTIGITSNIAWLASSNQTWLTVSPTSGANNGTLTLTANSANTNSYVRTATVTISGTGITAQTITVTQLGTEPVLSLSNNTLSLSSAANSNGSIEIASNIVWTARSNQIWLTVTPGIGSNNRTLTLSATSANTSTTARIATVTVSGTGVTAQTITVTQLGINPDMTNGLVAYYPFNGNANDESGNGNNGIIQGNVVLTTDRFGKTNRAYDFPGIAFNYIQVPDAPSLQMSVFTLNAWIFTTSDYGSGQVIQKGRDISNGHYGLYTTSVGGTNLYGGINNTTGINQPSIGVWHMVSGIVSGNKAKFYLDGKFMKDTTLSNSFLYSGSDPLAIGMHYFSGVPSAWTYPFKGKIDDIRIYNRSLSDNEISALYNLTTTAVDKININEKLKLYPNPAKTFIRISTSELLQRLEVCDISGRVLQFEIVNSDSYSFNINHLAKGVYIIKGFTDKGVVTSRFIKE